MNQVGNANNKATQRKERVVDSVPDTVTLSQTRVERAVGLCPCGSGGRWAGPRS